jgi:hypothetical protein
MPQTTTAAAEEEVQKAASAGRTEHLYSFEGLIKAATTFAQEKIDAMAERQKQEAQRVARKKPNLALVKSS